MRKFEAGEKKPTTLGKAPKATAKTFKKNRLVESAGGKLSKGPMENHALKRKTAPRKERWGLQRHSLFLF